MIAVCKWTIRASVAEFYEAVLYHQARSCIRLIQLQSTPRDSRNGVCVDGRGIESTADVGEVTIGTVGTGRAKRVKGDTFPGRLS